MLGSLPRNAPTYFWLLWIRAKNRVTGNEEAAGFWTGPIERNFTVGGQVRTYNPTASILGIDAIRYGAGTDNIQSQKVELNGISPHVEELMRTFEPKQAGFEIHRVRPVNPLSLSGLWIIEQAFKGSLDRINFNRTEADLTSGAMDETCTLYLMSASRMGTRTLTLKKSDVSQRLTDPADAGRKYSASKAKVAWMGEVKNPHEARELR